jgi:DDE domain
MTISFARHQFLPAIIRHAGWLYLRFTLSYRDVEDLLVERGLDVSYETVLRWVLKFRPLFARELRRKRPRPTARWHLDEMAVTIAGPWFWLRRAVDDEGEVLDILVQRRRRTNHSGRQGRAQCRADIPRSSQPPKQGCRQEERGQFYGRDCKSRVASACSRWRCRSRSLL